MMLVINRETCCDEGNMCMMMSCRNTDVGVLGTLLAREDM